MTSEAPPFDPIQLVGRLDDLQIFHDRQVQYRIELPGGALLDMFAFIRSDTDKVILSGQDALNPNKPPLPYFPRWSWYPDLPYSFVTFNDPTLYRSDELLGGWCQFDAAHFGIEMIADVLSRLLRAAGLSKSNAVLYGSSAGGFWALMTGALLPDAAVVADISQTNLLTYPPAHHVRRLFDVCYPGIPHEVVREQFADRLSVARFYERVGQRPRRIYYHQNTLDESHVETQMRPFIEAMRPFDIIDLRLYERRVERGTHCPRDKAGSIAAMLEPLTIN
jgi:pimeloyl-ACP methyl ester carboxylesterase